MQDIPRCFGCHDPVEHDPIFESPCGPEHHGCPSAVWHGLCLMKYREVPEFRAQVVGFILSMGNDDHCPHGHERDCPEHQCED